MITASFYREIFEKSEIITRIKSLGENQNIVIYGEKELLKALSGFGVDRLGVKAFITTKRSSDKAKIGNMPLINFVDLEQSKPNVVLGDFQELEKIKNVVNQHLDKEAVQKVKVLALIENCDFEEEFLKLYVKKQSLIKRINTICTKFKDEKVVIYPASKELAVIKKYFNITVLEKFQLCETLEDLLNSNPDVILVSKFNSINIMEKLYTQEFQGKKVEFLPLIKKSCLCVIKELWSS